MEVIRSLVHKPTVPIKIISPDLLVITPDLLRPAIVRVGVFVASAAPRKLPKTIEMLSCATGFAEAEVRKFIHDNSFQFELLISQERQTAVNKDVVGGLNPKQIAAKYGAPVSIIYPYYHRALYLSKPSDPPKIVKAAPQPLMSEIPKMLSTDQVVDAIISVGPFSCANPPLHPSESYIKRVCSKLKQSRAELCALFAQTDTEMPQLVRVARAKVIDAIKLKCRESDSNLDFALARAYDLSIPAARKHLRESGSD